MKNIKKMIVSATIIGTLGIVGTAYAAVTTPADIAASVTGKTIAAVNQERAAGKTYGAIAQEAGKLTEFQTQMLEQQKAILSQRVANGQLTQTQADGIYKSIESNQITCAGTGSACLGLGLGTGAGQGQGRGMGRHGAGMRSGMRLGQ
ncbi:MAG: DUF2680 domain-containing protein [Desulfosporosinus sp.]|nr:DUF2680 domain-containing protein [Desulfosporosinus sp.]